MKLDKIKNILIVLFSLFVLFYAIFLFLPKMVNLNLYKNEIQKLAKQYTNFDISIKNLELITTPTFQIGIKADDVLVDLPDKSRFLSLPCAKVKVSIPQLFFLNIKVSDVSIYKPFVNLEINDNKEFKAVKTVEKVLNDTEKAKPAEDISKKKFNLLSLIRINLPSVNVYDYRLYVYDNKIDEYLLLEGRNAKFAYLNGKRAKAKVNSKLYLNKNEQIKFDIDLNSFIPKKGKLDKEDDPSVRADVFFFNPVRVYKNYDVKGNVFAKIKLDNSKKGIIGKGYLDINDLTLNISGHKIPKSYIKAKIDGRKTFIDTDLSLADNQHLKLFGKIWHKKAPHFDLNIFSNGVHFNNLISLSKGLLDSIGVKNNLSYIKGEGYFAADTRIKTNSKKLKSQGKIEIVNGAIINTKTKLGFTNINSKILLDENKLQLKETGLKINDGELKIEGSIDRKSNTDFILITNKLPIPELFRAFAPEDIKKQINLSSGSLSMKATIKGKLRKAISILDTEINNLALSDKLNTVIVQNKNLKFGAKNDNKFNGQFKNEDLKIIFPYSKSTISNKLIEVDFDKNDIELNPTQFVVNKNSAITIKGEIDNYIKNPKFDFDVDGNLYALELKELLGVVFEPFVEAKGIIPIKAVFNGNSKKQTLRAQIFADPKNYISPIKIQQILNNQTIIQLLADFKGNRIKIKDTGLYSKIAPTEIVDNFDNNMIDTNKIVGIDGTIADVNTLRPIINLLKIDSKPLNISIVGLKDSKLNLNSELSIFGNVDSPRAKGKILISEVSIPDADLSLNELKVLINGKDANLLTDKLLINGSDLKVSSNINFSNLSNLSLSNFKFTSDMLNLDNILSSTNKITALIPKDPVSRPKADLPLTIKNGDYNIKNLITGNIKAINNTGELSLFENVLAVNNVSTNVFEGKILGDVNVDLVNFLVKANVQGKNLDTNLALIALANMKDTLSGKMSFDTNLSLQGIDFNNQVKSLNGQINFIIEDGTLGPFSKIENIFLSENLRQSEFFKTAMGSIINSAVSVDTSHFGELKGTILFDKTGVAHINPITMMGNTLCVKIGGDMDILANSIDAHVRGRLGSMVSSVLGPLANVNPVNIVKATPGLNVIMAKTFSVFCEKITKEEMDLIPDFSSDKSDFNATKFQIVLRGDVQKPLSLLKSFKWLVTDEEYLAAENFVTSIPETLPEGISTLEELRIYQEELAKQEAEAKTLKGKIKNLFKRNKTERI